MSKKKQRSDEIDLLALEEMLEMPISLDARRVPVVDMRFFADLPVEETGRMLGASPATVERDGFVARAFLRRRLGIEEEA